MYRLIQTSTKIVAQRLLEIVTSNFQYEETAVLLVPRRMTTGRFQYHEPPSETSLPDDFCGKADPIPAPRGSTKKEEGEEEEEEEEEKGKARDRASM